MDSKEELFAELYSSCQQRLLGYVIGLVRNSADAQDILQQAAVTAWEKFDEFDPDTDFMRWAITIARYKTLNFIKKRRNDKVYFDQALMSQLGEHASNVSVEVAEQRGAALSQCLKKLSTADSRLIECRYTHGLGSNQIAQVVERSQPSVCNSLRRIREALMQCIKRRLAAEG